MRVNVVSPGPVRTPWWTDPEGVADMMAAQTGADRETVLTEVVPAAMGITIGSLAEPEEVAAAVAFLASPRSSSTTGADLAMDGGFSKAI